MLHVHNLDPTFVTISSAFPLAILESRFYLLLVANDHTVETHTPLFLLIEALCVDQDYVVIFYITLSRMEALRKAAYNQQYPPPPLLS